MNKSVEFLKQKLEVAVVAEVFMLSPVMPDPPYQYVHGKKPPPFAESKIASPWTKPPKEMKLLPFDPNFLPPPPSYPPVDKIIREIPPVDVDRIIREMRRKLGLL